MSWRIVYNGENIRRWQSVVIEEDLESPITIARIRIFSSRPEQWNIGHKIENNRLEIYRRGVKKFDGFVEEARPDGRLNVEVVARSFEVLLLDELTSREVRYVNQTGNTVINQLLSNFSTKINAGTIDYPDVLAGTLRFSHDNLFRSMAKVCNIKEKDFWVTYNGTNFLLNVGDRGAGSENSPVETYSAGRDIAVTIEKQGSINIINRQRVFGSGDGINQIQACVPYIDLGISDNERSQGFGGFNANCEHAGASTSQSEFGIMEGVPVTDRSIVDTSSAIEVAKDILTKHSGVFKTLDVRFMRYYDLNIGDWIRVVDRKADLDVTTRIKTIDHKVTLGQIDSISVELYNPFDDTENKINLQERNATTQNIHGMGATNIFQVSEQENCSNGYPLNVRFRLPDDVKVVNKVLLSFRLSGYRAYHQGMTSEGAHSHGFTIPIYPHDISGLTGDIYLIGARQYHFGGNYQGQRLAHGETLSRQLQSQTTSEETGHSHPIQFGIITQNLTSPSVTVKVDGSVVGTYSDNIINDLDITEHITATGTWYNVSFEANKNMRIEANLYIKCYVESV